MTETVWNGSANTSWTNASNWSNGIGSDYHCIIPDTTSITNKPTLTANVAVGSISCVTSSEIVGGGYQIACVSEGTGSEGLEGYAANFDGTVTGELSIKITTAGFTYIDLAPASGNIHDLEISHSGGDYKVLVGDTTLTGTLWVKDGNLKMHGDSDTLSVTEDIRLGNGSDTGFFGHDDHDGAMDARSLDIITAGSTFTSTEGVLTLDGELSDYVFNNDGVFVHNNGTVTITTSGTTRIDGAGASGNQFYHLTYNSSGGTLEMYSDLIVANQLTVAAGELHTGTSGYGWSNLTADLVHGSGTVKTGSGTHTTTNDWRPNNTQLQVDGGTFVIADHMGGSWDCNSKQVTIGCARFHSGISMTNGVSLVSGNTAEDVIVTATSGEDNASVYGPLQGRINLVTASSGSKNFALKEDLTVNGRIVVSGDGEFRTYNGSNTYDLHIDGQTYHDDNGGSDYSCLDITGSSQFMSGSSTVITDVSLGNNICDVGSFNGTDGQAVTGWTAYGTNTILYDSNQAKITRTSDASGGSSTGAYFMLNSTALSTSGLTVGKVYEAKFKAKVNTGTVNLKWTTQSSLPFGAEAETAAYQANENTRNEALTSTSYVWRYAYFVAGNATSVYMYCSNMAEGQIVHIDDMEIREVVQNGKAGTTEQHTKSYGLDFNSNQISNLGTGFIYACGFRCGSVSYQVNKTSGRLVVGSGDSNEYFTHSALLNLGSTDIVLLGNGSAQDTIGINVSSGSFNWTCAGFYYYLTTSSKFLYYWNYGAGGNASGSDNSDAFNSRTAGRIHTISGGVHILQGELRQGAASGANHNGTGFNWGDLTIYSGGKLECDQTNSTSDTHMEVDSTFNSILVKSGGTLSLSPTTTFIDNEAGTGYSIEVSGTCDHNEGSVEVNYDGVSFIKIGSSLKHLKINRASRTFEWIDNTTINGDLTVNAGTFQPYGTSQTLTVSGETKVNSTGILGRAEATQAYSFYGLAVESSGTYIATQGTTTITGGGSPNYLGVSMKNGSTFNNNDGTFQIDSSSESWLHSNVDNLDVVFHHLTINGANVYIQKGDVTVEGDLTINAGKALTPYNNHNNLTVNGTATISGTLGKTQWGLNEPTRAAVQFGALDIPSGGNYIATQQTTTLNGGGANSDANQSLYGAGTFTHNKGTLHYASGAGFRTPVRGTFYNVTTDVNLYGYDGVLLPQPTMPDGTTASDFLSIEGTLRINNNAFNPYSIDGLYIHNLIIGDGSGGLNSAKISLAESDVFNGTVYVDNVLINGDGQFLFGDGDETSSTAGSSALNVYGSFRNLGGNVTIE